MYQDEPYTTHELAAKHFCDEVGSTLYCPARDCPYCSERTEADR